MRRAWGIGNVQYRNVLRETGFAWPSGCQILPRRDGATSKIAVDIRGSFT